MESPNVSKEQIVRALDQLPPESLAVVAEFVEFLQSRSHLSQSPRRIVKLGGIWQGYSFSEEEINSARQETWSGLRQDLDD
jgi:hypothetical protein